MIYDALGYLSVIFSIFSFLSHDTKPMRIYGGISAFFFAISIYGYGGINGAFVSIVSLAVKIASFYLPDRALNIMKASSVIIAFMSFYFLFKNEGFIGVLPSMSLIFIIYADLQKNILKMKSIYFYSAITWLTYAIYINSIPAILYDVIAIAMLTYSIVAINRKKVYLPS